MWTLFAGLLLLIGNHGAAAPEVRRAEDLVHPDSTASLSEQIQFYVERLGDTSYVAFQPLEDLEVEWYEAAEQLGVIGAPAVPSLIDVLRSTTDDYERTQAFYALLLAAQDYRIRVGLGIGIPDYPMAYPEPASHAALREQWLDWWDVNGAAIRTIDSAR